MMTEINLDELDVASGREESGHEKGIRCILQRALQREEWALMSATSHF